MLAMKCLGRGVKYVGVRYSDIVNVTYSSNIIKDKTFYVESLSHINKLELNVYLMDINDVKYIVDMLNQLRSRN